MPTIGLYGGPLKKTLIERAFGLCGQSITEFELTPEEYDLGLTSMNDLAATLGSTFPFNYPAHGNGDAGDESGVPPTDVLGFTAMLAQEIAPNIGKSFSPNGPQATAKSALALRYQVIPYRTFGRQTIRGAGNRYYGWVDPFFGTRIADDEIGQ